MSAKAKETNFSNFIGASQNVSHLGNVIGGQLACLEAVHLSTLNWEINCSVASNFG